MGFILDTTVTIGYDTPWRQVHAMLIEAARRTPGVLADPAPHVFQTALSDFYVEYRLVCQAMPSEPRPRADVLSALHAQRPGRVQRARRADHVAALPRRSRREAKVVPQGAAGTRAPATPPRERARAR